MLPFIDNSWFSNGQFVLFCFQSQSLKLTFPLKSVCKICVQARALKDMLRSEDCFPPPLWDLGVELWWLDYIYTARTFTHEPFSGL